MSTDEVFLKDLVDRIVNTNDDSCNELAVEMLCKLMQNNMNLVKICVDILKDKIQNVSVAVKSLELTNTCMAKCGQDFQNRINRHNFLNILSKLVALNFEGKTTPLEIKNKIMDYLLLWTTLYPEREKIKNVYAALVEKGVNHEPSMKLPTTATATATNNRCTFMSAQEEEQWKKLLKSRDKSDIKKANLLISYYVNRDAKQKERKVLVNGKLNEIENIINLLDEILNNWIEDKHQLDEEELSLIKQLNADCIKHKPEMALMPEIIEENDIELLGRAIKVNEDLLAVIEKCDSIVSNTNTATNASTNSTSILAQTPMSTTVSTVPSSSSSSSVLETKEAAKSNDLLKEFLSDFPKEENSDSNSITLHPLDELSEIFTINNNNNNNNNQNKNSEESKVANIFTNLQLLEPTPISKLENNESKEEGMISSETLLESPLKDIDKISEKLLKDNVKNGQIMGTFTKTTSKKLTLNDLVKTRSENGRQKSPENVQINDNACNIGFEHLNIIDKLFINQTQNDSPLTTNPTPISKSNNTKILVDIPKESPKPDLKSQNESFEKDNEDDRDDEPLQISEIPQINNTSDENDLTKKIQTNNEKIKQYKYLSDIQLSLSEIQPSKEYPPRKILDTSDLQVTLHFAVNKPSTDVSVIVVTTVNQSSHSLEKYQLSASVKKPCKLRTLQPTNTSLPGVEPLQLPSIAIRQILLLQNPKKDPVDITFIIEYTLDNDPDPNMESFAVENIPCFS